MSWALTEFPGRHTVGGMKLTIEIPDELAKQIETGRERLEEIIRRGLRHGRQGGRSPVAEMFEFLAGEPEPEQIIAFQPSESSTLRLRTLLDGSRGGSLSARDEAELDTLESLNGLM